ncbi:MAG: O-antigen ligase family protein [Planctomycetes bacterium]|nr:O-antigen ligase family protein [Planctomycetota bacterium]
MSNTLHSQNAGRSGLAALLAVAVGVLLFADYGALSVSQALTGSSGNWLAFAGALQFAVLGIGLFVAPLRGLLPWSMVLGMAGLWLLAFGHAVPIWAMGNELTEYPGQKTAAVYLLLTPALAAGALVGSCPESLRLHRALWFGTPLLLMCAAALLINPRWLTIEYYAEPAVFFGMFVLPAHQPLALCLTKLALAAFAAQPDAHAARWRRAMPLVGASLLLGVVLLTGARSYAAALVLALGVQAALSGRRIGILVCGGALGLVVLQSLASEVVQERLDPTQALESLAYQEREQAWQVAWQAFAADPLVGVGPGQFAAAGGWFGRVYPHNLPLEIAAEFGIVGLCCLLAMFGPPLWWMARCLWLRRNPGPLGQFAAAFLVFAMVGSLAVGDLIRNYFAFFALGLAAGPLRAAAGAAIAPSSAGALATANWARWREVTS